MNYDQVTIETPSLYLPLDDATLLAILNEAEMRADQEYGKHNIKKRGADNTEFWLGNQVDESKLDLRYQMAHVDNLSHENLENQIKLASGKMPDIFVAPPDKQEYNLENARDIQQWLRERIDTNTIKRLIKNGLRCLNLNLTAIIKPRWDYSKADFVFELLNVDDVRFSEGSKIPEDGFTIDGVDIAWHYVEENTNVVLAKFKKKQDQLIREIGIQNKTKDVPARIRYTEAHFRWFDDQGRLGEGVAWRYGNLIMEAMRNPYYDYDNPKNNYFDRPRKPFILFSYMNLGKGIYEATTNFEQGKPVNKIINKRRRQITEISDRAVPKLAFSGSAMTKEMARNISPSPQEGILLNDLGADGDIRKAMFIIPATPPNPILYQDMANLQSRMNSIFATQGTNNAQMSSSASGISKQISREGDLVTSDDIVDIVVERVVSEMTAWGMQFARLFYDDDRPPHRSTNTEGETEFIELTREKLETDIQVVVKASTNDKTTRRADAIQMLSGKITDPYTLFEDLEVPNPKERTKRLLSFIEAQTTGNWSKYLDQIGVDISEDSASTDDAQRDIELIEQGGTPKIDKRPSEGYVSAFMAYVNSPEYEQLDQTVKDKIQEHVQALKAKVAESAQEAEGEQQQEALPNGMEQGQAGYQPEVDTSTQFGGGGAQGSTTDPMAMLKQRLQNPTASTQPGVTGRARV